MIAPDCMITRIWVRAGAGMAGFGGIIRGMTARVVVVGAGIVGLTCAVRLAEAGLQVDVLARELPRETMSAISPGLWLPPHPPDGAGGAVADAVTLWARETLAELRRLAADGDATGVRILPGTLLHRRPRPGPFQGYDVEAVRVTGPAPGYPAGDRADLPAVDVPRHLDHLAARLAAADGTLTRLPLPALPTRGLVVDCAGVAARALARDDGVRPVRGQCVLLADPGLPGWWCDDDPAGPTVVVPHGRVVAVGGTRDDGVWDTTPDEATGRRLVERAARLEPRLRDAAVLRHRAGLRPARRCVRVDVERLPTPDDPGHVRVHCYGHGDDGIALAWGSAGAVVDAVRSVVAA